ncbi:MAG: methyltransferase [Aquiluna sp.]|jgi:methyltransferase|tara:strand:- start:3157 stop:3693 length:537 start_codon:yes stop_codon:yes gene_type:complete
MILTVSVMLFIGLILATGAERIYELVVSTRNAKLAFKSGGIEYGHGHLPFMIALHTGLLAGAIIEVVFFDRQFLGSPGWIFLAIAIGCQSARYWFIWALGSQWNTRVIVIPGAQLVRKGPYSLPWLRHPNYWVVAIEGIALPMVHSAWITATIFTALNAALLLGFRIPTENKALKGLR